MITPEKQKERVLRRQIKDKRSYYLRQARRTVIERISKAKKLSIPFLASLLLKQKCKCALSGVEMTPDSWKMSSISVDRVDSDQGYTEDNVQFVCLCVNFMKNEWKNSDVKEFMYKSHRSFLDERIPPIQE